MVTPYLLENIPLGTTFRVVECESTAGRWLATTATDVTVISGSEEDGRDVEVEFGNLCLNGGGGLTMGFWSNRNGQATMESYGMNILLAGLRGLNLKGASGNDFNPSTYTGFRTWLRQADAVNIRYMLSAQLAAMYLNTTAGDVDGDALVYAPGVCEDTDFISINALINLPNEALADGEASRHFLEELKDALDDANNDINFVQPGPTCPIAFDCCFCGVE